MTYNFDPDQWYENQRRLLEARLERGEIDAARLAAEIAELDQRLDEMLSRLDGSFVLPATRPSGQE